MNEKIEVILVDIGNTRIKSCEVAGDALRKTRSWESFQQLNDAYDEDVPFMICSTSSANIERSNSLVLSARTSLPINLNYETPETLGSDRIAAAVGALEAFPNQNRLVVDLGTCITMDFVASDGTFHGGIISPGLKMRMRSMSQFTANLPDISQNWNQIAYQAIGKSTKQCLLSGAFGGVVKEIEGTIRQLEKDFTSINVILSGGDAPYFESRLKAHIFAGSKIVLMGLHRVWKHQLT